MSQTVIAAGLQKTGKTTFLAALWDVVSSGEVTGSLKLERTEGDMQYLNEIRGFWADYKAITRTGPASDKPVTMRLTEPGSPNVTKLAWTDMLGERFERQWTDRVWTRGYQQLVDDAVGILLFTHPSRITESPLIIEAQKLRRQLEPEGEPIPPRDIGTVSPKPTPFDARKVPTQVQLVELLQFVDTRRAGANRLRLSLVVSAWDLVEKVTSIGPDASFTKRMPLLHQFLEANDDRFEPMVFGVSAQGCDYEDAQTLQKAHHRAAERIKVVYNGNISHDITAPVKWAIGSARI